ncbi:unnamed protein product [Chrysoparadoxa australica]
MATYPKFLHFRCPPPAHLAPPLPDPGCWDAEVLDRARRPAEPPLSHDRAMEGNTWASSSLHGGCTTPNGRDGSTEPTKVVESESEEHGESGEYTYEYELSSAWVSHYRKSPAVQAIVKKHSMMVKWEGHCKVR